MRLNLKANSITGVAASSTAVLRLPLGYNYHEIQFQLGGTTFALANITEIRVNLNGKTIEQYSAAQLDSMNQYRGMQAYGSAKVLCLRFDRPNMASQQAEEATAIDTGKVTAAALVGKTAEAADFYIELDINSSASAPTLSATYTVSESKGNGIGIIRYLRRLTEAPSGANTDYQIATIPKGALETQSINAIYAYDAGIITNAIVEKNQYKLFDRTNTLNAFLQVNFPAAKRVAQSNWLMIDFCETGYTDSIVDLRDAQDFRLRLNVSGAGTITYFVEYLGALAI